MKHLLAYLFVLLSILLMVGCEKDEPDVVEVDSRLQFFFDRFAEEGAARGVIVDFDLIEIEGEIKIITDGSQVAGQCQSNSTRANTIIIDQEFWDRSNELDREFVIYHELGHCYLDRDHLDAAEDNGSCVSIMHSGTGDCTNVFNELTRSDYLDELFNP